MKVAIVVVQFPPKWLAGTEIATYNIAKHLSRRGHEIHVITSKDKGMLKNDKKNGFFIHRAVFPKVKFLGVLFFWIGIIWCLKRIDPQIIHIQMIDMGMPGFLAKKIFKKPYLVYSRGSDVYYPWPQKELISKLVLNNASAIISLTKDMKTEILKSYNGEIIVIPNGIDPEKYKKKGKEDIRHNNENIVLYVGGLRKVKGVKYLIEAIDIVVKNQPNTRLIIVGDGKERGSLENLVKNSNLEEHVTFIGNIPNENVPNYMISSDIFVLPSLSEGFPNVILEAMASGLPIICSDVGGVREIIKHRENGLIVPPKNVVELSNNILTLLKDDDLRENLSKTNKISVMDYTWENIIGRIEKTYEMIANETS